METSQLPPPTAPKHRAHGPAAPPAFEPVRPAPMHDGNGSTGHEEASLDVTPPRPIFLIALAVAGLLLLLGLFLVGFLPREQQGRTLRGEAAAALDAPVMVTVAQPHPGPGKTAISIPGNLRPWQEVSIFARTTGYLKKFYVDISNPVQVGQLMADIDSPEVDQQLRQAQAAVLQTRAAVDKSISDRNLAKVTFDRYQLLAGTHSVTQQDVDQKRSDLQAAEANVESARANVAAAEANVQRLMQLQQFEKVIAPFSGVVTGRAYDVGALILADPTTADTQPLFKIAENDVLRVFVNVPQSSALRIRKGMNVDVTAREVPGQVFTGTVMGTTNYLDQSSRSLLTEVKVQNLKGPDGELSLLPGMYVTVNFVVEHAKPPLLIPGPAVVNNADGTQVAVVREGKAHFMKVVLGQDTGKEVEVVEGLTGDEQIIANPGERVVEGAPVKAGNDPAAGGP